MSTKHVHCLFSVVECSREVVPLAATINDLLLKMMLQRGTIKMETNGKCIITAENCPLIIKTVLINILNTDRRISFHQSKMKQKTSTHIHW